jgi:hypothetical protein
MVALVPAVLSLSAPAMAAQAGLMSVELTPATLTLVGVRLGLPSGGLIVLRPAGPDVLRPGGDLVLRP